VRWYLRYRLSYADVAELLAEWGVRVDPLAIYAWVREFAPPYEDAAHPFRPAVGRSWSVDESDTKIASKPADVIRAIDGRGQVVDVYASQRRATIERDHQHLKGRLRPTRGFKTLTGAQVLCRGYALLRNLRGGFYDLGRLGDAVALSPQPAVVQAWAVLTGMLLGR
jgi:transposase-like protein